MASRMGVDDTPNRVWSSRLHQPVPQGDLSGDNIMDQHIIDLFAQGSALEKFAHNSLASLLLW